MKGILSEVYMLNSQLGYRYNYLLHRIERVYYREKKKRNGTSKMVFEISHCWDLDAFFFEVNPRICAELFETERLGNPISTISESR